jgi:hypothetical protein
MKAIPARDNRSTSTLNRRRGEVVLSQLDLTRADWLRANQVEVSAAYKPDFITPKDNTKLMADDITTICPHERQSLVYKWIAINIFHPYIDIKGQIVPQFTDSLKWVGWKKVHGRAQETGTKPKDKSTPLKCTICPAAGSEILGTLITPYACLQHTMNHAVSSKHQKHMRNVVVSADDACVSPILVIPV